MPRSKLTIACGVAVLTFLVFVCYQVWYENAATPEKRPGGVVRDSEALQPTIPPIPSSGDPPVEDLLKDLSDQLVTSEGRKARDILTLAKHRDPRKFVKLRWRDGLPYRVIRLMYDKRSLPTFYALLKDPEYAADWGIIATIIAYLGDDTEAISALVDFGRRPMDWRDLDPEEAYHRFRTKMFVLSGIGLIGGGEADEILRNALTPEGTTSFAAEWIHGPLPHALGKKKGEAMGTLRGMAALGLIYTQKAENIELVELAYRKEYDRCSRNKAYTEFLFHLVDAMAIRDVIAEQGMREYVHLLGTRDHFNRIRPYLKKYKLRRSTP